MPQSSDTSGVPRLKYLPALATTLVIAFLWAPFLWLAAQCAQALAARPEQLAEAMPLRGASRAMFVNTLQLVALTVCFAAIFGLVCGVALSKLSARSRGALQVLVALPLALPPTLLATAFLEWSRLPPLRSLASLGATRAMEVPPVLVASLVLAACFFPAIALATGAALRSIPRDLDDAARLFGTPLQRWVQVLAPLIRPAFLSGCGIVAALAMWEMGAPDLLDVRSYSVQIYRDLFAANSLDAGGKAVRAALDALPLLVLAALALWPAWKMFRASARFSPDDSLGTARPLSVASRVVVALSLGVVLLSIGAPLGVFGSNWSLGTAREVWRANAPEIQNTLFVATWSACANVALALLFVLSWRSWSTRPKRVARLGVCVPLLFSPVLTGVALLGFSNRAAFDWLHAGWASDSILWDWIGEQVGRYGLLCVGFSIRFVPVAAWLLDAAFSTRGEELEDAARSLGASTWSTIRDISLPLARPWIVGAWALIWALSAGELSLAVLLNGPGGQTLPVPIFNLMHIGATAEVAALSLIALAQTSGAIALAVWLGRAKSPKMER